MPYLYVSFTLIMKSTWVINCLILSKINRTKELKLFLKFVIWSSEILGESLKHFLGWQSIFFGPHSKIYNRRKKCRTDVKAEPFLLISKTKFCIVFYFRWYHKRSQDSHIFCLGMGETLLAAEPIPVYWIHCPFLAFLFLLLSTFFLSLFLVAYFLYPFQGGITWVKC